MDRLALLELRDRLAKATGPNRELDADIHAFIAGRITHHLLPAGYTMAAGADHRLAKAPYITRDRGPSSAYTASIDAAVTLWPNGYPSLEARLYDDRAVRWISHVATPDWKRWSPVSNDWCNIFEGSQAANQALAICLARIEYEIAKTPEPT